jgi:hypothetical protein
MSGITLSNLQAAAANDSEQKIRRQMCMSVPVEVYAFSHNYPRSWNLHLRQCPRDVGVDSDMTVDR